MINWWDIFSKIMNQIGLYPVVLICNNPRTIDQPLVVLDVDTNFKCAKNFMNYPKSYKDGKFEDCQFLIAFKKVRE